MHRLINPYNHPPFWVPVIIYQDTPFFLRCGNASGIRGSYLSEAGSRPPSDSACIRMREREREGGKLVHLPPPPIGFPRATGSHGVPFPHPLFPLFDFQVRVAAAERGCVENTEIRKKIRKYKIQKHLGKARRPTVEQGQLLRSYPAFSGSGLPVEQASYSQLWTPNAPLSAHPLTISVFVLLTPGPLPISSNFI